MPDPTQPVVPPIPFPLSDPKTIAVALADGGRLADVVHEAGRVVFIVSGLPEDWHERLARDEIRVSGLTVIAQLERVLGMIKAAQQRRGPR